MTSSAREDELITLCKHYANLHAEVQDGQTELRQLGSELLRRISTNDSVTIAKNVVLVHTTKPMGRRPITQTILKNVGISEAHMDKILDATAPDPDQRQHMLKVMVTSAYKAMKPVKRAREESEGDESASASQE
jgi:hypothetical protein